MLSCDTWSCDCLVLSFLVLPCPLRCTILSCFVLSSLFKAGAWTQNHDNDQNQESGNTWLWKSLILVSICPCLFPYPSPCLCSSFCLSFCVVVVLVLVLVLVVVSVSVSVSVSVTLSLSLTLKPLPLSSSSSLHLYLYLSCILSGIRICLLSSSYLLYFLSYLFTSAQIHLSLCPPPPAPLPPIFPPLQCRPSASRVHVRPHTGMWHESDSRLRSIYDRTTIPAHLCLFVWLFSSWLARSPIIRVALRVCLSCSLGLSRVPLSLSVPPPPLVSSHWKRLYTNPCSYIT